jgi:hypothetical protein
MVAFAVSRGCFEPELMTAFGADREGDAFVLGYDRAMARIRRAEGASSWRRGVGAEHTSGAYRRGGAAARMRLSSTPPSLDGEPP